MLLLWRVRMKLRQKLGIGAFLCLGLCITIVACVRFSGTHTHANIVQGWEYFWLEVEACVAVCMVSLCVFRSVVVMEERRARFQKGRQWYSSTVAKLRDRNKLSGGNFDLNNLPTIPSATLSSMRTFIRSSGLGVGAEYSYELPNRRTLGGIEGCV